MMQEMLGRGVNRRGFVGACALAPLAGMAMPALAAKPILDYTGRYAIDSHRIVDGYFAWPRGRGESNVVLLITETGVPDAKARALARSHAAEGRLAIVPDLRATYAADAGEHRLAMTSALMNDSPRFRRMLPVDADVLMVAV